MKFGKNLDEASNMDIVMCAKNVEFKNIMNKKKYLVKTVERCAPPP